MAEFKLGADGRPAWSGGGFREWAEGVAQQIDQGLVDLSVDMDYSPDRIVWTFYSQLTEAGRARRDEMWAEARRLAEEMAAEEEP